VTDSESAVATRSSPRQRSGRFSVADRVYEQLRELIIRARWAPGKEVPEEMLAETLQVSRTPLRDAIQRLDSDGLVARRPNGRLYVTEVSAVEVHQLFSVRMALEDLALCEALEHLTNDHICLLRLHIQEMERLSRTVSHNVAEVGVDFHKVLYEAGENKINRQLLESLEVRIDRYRYMSTEGARERQIDSIREHKMIYDAVVARQGEKARAALRLHLENAKESVLSTLRSMSMREEGKGGDV
jgi:DNA-binding GntR family transcriptional regulator